MKKQEVQKIISQKLLSNGFNNYTVKKYLNELLSIEDNSITRRIANKLVMALEGMSYMIKSISTLKFNNIIIFLIITVLLGILLKRKKFF